MFKTISSRNRWLILAIAAGVSLVYFIPIWWISLKAPQYRDGLDLIIWSNTIEGGNEFDLKNINILNHYVGMAEIYTKDFIEFLIMPYVLGVMILGALITFIFPKIFMVYFGLISFIASAIAGLYDFHRLEYKYGHNLDPDAALSIPGISFEPPLFGCKAMMNFNTCSWPHVGAIILIISGGILTYIIIDEWIRDKKLVE